MHAYINCTLIRTALLRKKEGVHGHEPKQTILPGNKEIDAQPIV